MDRLRCSFCDKSQDEVKKLIAGPGVYICNECVDLCQEILREQADRKGVGRRARGSPTLTPDMPADALRSFLEGIGDVRLLTAQEEVDLAKRIERGDRDAKQEMVESNVRLVVSIAHNYRDRGRPLVELIQAGTRALIGAAEKYDYRNGIKFSTFAADGIRQAIDRAPPGTDG